MPAVEPVADRLGHRVGLVPDDRVPQDPPVLLQRERDPPGQAEQVLRAQPGRAVGGDVLAEVGVHPGRAAAAGGVGVAEVEPARAVVGEHPPRLAEHVPHGVDVGGRGVLVPVLAGHAVVALAPVGRAGDDAVRRLVGHAGEHGAGVADVQRARRGVHRPPPSHRTIAVRRLLICGAAPVEASRNPRTRQATACQARNPMCR